jgi:predicted cupin superfamily sugar epimerase
LTLRIAAEGGKVETIRLGPEIAGGERPQAIVPAGVWQSAESRGDWTLVGCTVAPGFRFEGFELACDSVSKNLGLGVRVEKLRIRVKRA